MNDGVSFCNNSMVARIWRAFQVSQSSVEALFRWGGKRSTILQQIYSGNSIPYFIWIARVFWKIL